MGTWAHNSVGPEMWIGPEADDLRGGTAPSGELEITENGEYDVTEYATADVQVAGGSSDFSTAKVTLNITLAGQALAETISLGGYMQNSSGPFEAEFYYNTVESPFDCYLYKGEAVINRFSVEGTDRVTYDTITTASASGDITWDSDNSSFVVAGDGVINVTLSSAGPL